MNRTIVYPLRLRAAKPFPIEDLVAGMFFTGFNGLLQGLCLTQYDEYANNSIYQWSFIGGVALFICGFVINLHSDSVLRNLRGPKERGYKVPYGGMFEYVTAANYFGEFIEWLGFAIAGNNAGGYAFATETFCNLFARAYHVCGSCFVCATFELSIFTLCLLCNDRHIDGITRNSKENIQKIERLLFRFCCKNI